VYGSETTPSNPSSSASWREKPATVATAESCTGGWLGQRIHERPRFPAASTRRGRQLRQRSQDDLDRSDRNAGKSMAAVSPSAPKKWRLGSKKHSKPHMASASRSGRTRRWNAGEASRPRLRRHRHTKRCKSHKYSFPGTRETVRLRSTQVALMLLRNALLEL